MHIKDTNLAKKILTWYDNNKRVLPWRISQKSRRNQYYRLLSEFMLQQTQVKTVIPYFKNFVKKIPNLKTLSQSDEKQILKLWEGLGYYKRAKNLHRTAKILVKNYKGKIPNKFEEIKKLPGIGEYTSNILLALIYNQSRIGIDGNVRRLFVRLFNKNDIKDLSTKFIKNCNESVIKYRNANLAEALIEFGAIICKAKNPKCNICDLKNNCSFFKKKIFKPSNFKNLIKEKNYNVYCFLKKTEMKIALTKNTNLSFLNNFNVPKIQISKFNRKKIRDKKEWIYLCTYKNNISNIKMNISLFYKFTKTKPPKFRWYSVDQSTNEFIPTFTKKIISKIKDVYINNKTL